MSRVKMNVLPQAILQSPGEHPRFMEQTVGPSLDFARIHLIKDKDGIDDYLAKNIKGLSKQEAAAWSLNIQLYVSSKTKEEETSATD